MLIDQSAESDYDPCVLLLMPSQFTYSSSVISGKEEWGDELWESIHMS